MASIISVETMLQRASLVELTHMKKYFFYLAYIQFIYSKGVYDLKIKYKLSVILKYLGDKNDKKNCMTELWSKINTLKNMKYFWVHGFT